MDNERQLDKLWQEFAEKQLKPETSAEDKRVLYRTFIAGAFEMLKVVAWDHKFLFDDLNKEFEEIAEIIKESER